MRTSHGPVKPLDLRLEDQLKFWGERTSYTVRSISDRYVILTKPAPFHERGTKVWYTVIDWEKGWRGPHNSYGHGATSEEEIQETQEALDSGKIELSVRRNVILDIEWVHSPRRYFFTNEEIL